MSSPWRRTRCAAVGVAGALALTAALTGPTAAAPAAPQAPVQDAAFNNGTGSAIAESLRVDPVAGGLSFGVGVGQALAGHQNTVGTAESRAVNLGVIGVTLAGEGCDGGAPTLPAESQPQPLRAETGEEGADVGFSAGESIAGNDLPEGVYTKFARATTQPLAEAITTGAPFDIPGLLSISGTRSTATSGVVNGNTREAIATTEIAQISLAAGAVTLGGLRTQAIHRTGAVEEVSGTFSIGSAAIAGVPIPIGDPVTALTQLNVVLRPLGLELRAPEFSVAQTSDSTIAVVSPFAVAIIPSALRDGITGPLLGALQPVRQNVFDLLLDIDCGNSTYITVVDIVLNALSAGGSLAVEMGRVQATTGEITLVQGGPGRRPTTPTPAPAAPATPNTPAARPSTPTAAAPVTPSAPTGGGGTVARPTAPIDDAVEAVSFIGERGGIMALVAGGGLLLLFLCAEGDRRKMRRAQRMIPLGA